MKFPKKIFYGLCASAIATSSSLAGELTKAWETPDTLSGPESAIYHAGSDMIFVSNVNGAPNEKDSNGFISTLSPDGTVIKADWVTGLHAPKGLALSGDNLYVSDVDTLVEINIESGAISNTYAAADSQFLNDVAADADGNIYVSDMMTNTVYRLSGGELSPWLQSDDLENPNGLFVEGDNLIVGSWGVMTDGFATEVPGHLKSVSLADQSIQSLGNGTAVGNLDGVESDGNGNYYVTDWIAGKLLHIMPSGESNELLDLGQGSADHAVMADQGLIVIPMMNDNKVVAYKIAE